MRLHLHVVCQDVLRTNEKVTSITHRKAQDFPLIINAMHVLLLISAQASAEMPVALCNSVLTAQETDWLSVWDPLILYSTN